jgi:pimeloyl-ACP methyl ester carboxylesterase
MELRELSIHGQRIAYRTAGTGPVVLLLHGMAGSSRTWHHVTPTLARHCTIVAPDLLGHGQSAKPRAEYSLGAHANVLRDMLAVLGYERATLVGHSYGGGVAMQLAYQFPTRCERLVLVGSGGLGQEVNGLLRALALPGAEQLFPLACSPPLRDVVRGCVAGLRRCGLHPSRVAAEIFHSYASLADRDTRQAFFRTLRAVIDHDGQAVSATDRLYLTSPVPTLIVWGAHDAVIPVAHAYSAHDAIRNSRLEVFDEAGHYPHCDAPERFATTLLDFIASSAGAELSEDSWHAILRDGPAETPAASSHQTPVFGL